MASMRKLRRRLLRWQRYFDQYRHVPFGPNQTDKMGTPAEPISWGRFNDQRSYWRIRGDLNVEEDRRRPPTDDGCCTFDAGHDGPCAWFCSWCSGEGSCPGCDGFDDLGCDECGGSLACQYCNGAGEFVEEWPVPHVVTEHAFEQAGLL
jgi:hypothetical protein